MVHEKFVQGRDASGVVDGMGPKFMDNFSSPSFRVSQNIFASDITDEITLP